MNEVRRRREGEGGEKDGPTHMPMLWEYSHTSCKSNQRRGGEVSSRTKGDEERKESAKPTHVPLSSLPTSPHRQPSSEHFPDRKSSS